MSALAIGGLGLAHRHRGFALQQFNQLRLVRRVHVLHDDVGQTACWQVSTLQRCRCFF